MATAQNQTNAAFLNNVLATSIAGSSANELNQNAGLALGSLGQGYGQARTDINAQTPLELSALGQGYGTGNAALTAGYNTATGAINAGIGEYQPWINSGTAADTMNMNALGLNGPGGNAAATAAFQTSPGYTFNVNQATDAAARKAASLGVAGSGNTLEAITRLGENLANNEYSSWLTNLNNASSRGLTAASGAAAGNYNLGTAAMNYGTGINSNAVGQGTNTANLYGNLGTSLASLGTGQGTGEASIYTGLGNSLAGVNNQFMQTLGQNNTNAGQAQDAAHQANSQLPMQWAGLGLNALGSGVRLFGGGGLGGIGGGAGTAMAPF